MPPMYIFDLVCIFSCSVDKKIVHCCFSIDKMKKQKQTNKQNKEKKYVTYSSFWMC